MIKKKIKTLLSFAEKLGLEIRKKRSTSQEIQWKNRISMLKVWVLALQQS